MKRLPMILTSITAVIVISLFSGCGQSGALYIPGDSGTLAVPPSETPGDEKDKDDKVRPATD